jgi:hypothetical protein
VTQERGARSIKFPLGRYSASVAATSADMTGSGHSETGVWRDLVAFCYRNGMEPLDCEAPASIGRRLRALTSCPTAGHREHREHSLS